MPNEKTAPMMKNSDRPIRSPQPSAGSKNSSTNTITPKIASVLHCRLRYAAAPSCTALAMSCIFVVPWPAASTSLSST